MLLPTNRKYIRYAGVIALIACVYLWGQRPTLTHQPRPTQDAEQQWLLPMSDLPPVQMSKVQVMCIGASAREQQTQQHSVFGIFANYLHQRHITYYIKVSALLPQGLPREDIAALFVTFW